MTEFVICYTTRDGREAKLHAYKRGEGAIRDENHIADIVDVFRHGNETEIIAAPPQPDQRVLFEIHLGVKDTRRGGSAYFGWDYRQMPGCPQCVAEAGMDIYLQVKHLLRQARKHKGARRG